MSSLICSCVRLTPCRLQIKDNTCNRISAAQMCLKMPFCCIYNSGHIEKFSLHRKKIFRKTTFNPSHKVCTSYGSIDKAPIGLHHSQIDNACTLHHSLALQMLLGPTEASDYLFSSEFILKMVTFSYASKNFLATNMHTHKHVQTYTHFFSSTTYASCARLKP